MWLNLTEACPTAQEGVLPWSGGGGRRPTWEGRAVSGGRIRVWAQPARRGQRQTGQGEGGARPCPSPTVFSQHCLQRHNQQAGEETGGQESFIFNETLADGFVWMWEGGCVYSHVCTCVVRIWMCVCMCVSVYVYVQTVYLCVHVEVCAQLSVCVCVYLYKLSVCAHGSAVCASVCVCRCTNCVCYVCTWECCVCICVCVRVRMPL